MTSEDAILAIRHVVQEHGDEGTRLGGRLDPEAVHWLGGLLGWTWPRSYVDILAVHNGVVVQDAIVLPFMESIECFLYFHQKWHGPNGFWPIASDGCGNYFALSMGQQGDAQECPVVFIETITSAEQPQSKVAASYAHFICDHMKRQCRRKSCSQVFGES